MKKYWKHQPLATKTRATQHPPATRWQRLPEPGFDNHPLKGAQSESSTFANIFEWNVWFRVDRCVQINVFRTEAQGQFISIKLSIPCSPAVPESTLINDLNFAPSGIGNNVLCPGRCFQLKISESPASIIQQCGGIPFWVPLPSKPLCWQKEQKEPQEWYQ